MTAVKGTEIFLTFAQAHSLSNLVQDNGENLWWNRKMTFDTLSHSSRPCQEHAFPSGKVSSFSIRILTVL